MQLDTKKREMNVLISQAIRWDFDKLLFKFLKISAYCRREFVHEARHKKSEMNVVNSQAIRWDFDKLLFKFLEISAYCRREFVHEARHKKKRNERG